MVTAKSENFSLKYKKTIGFSGKRGRGFFYPRDLAIGSDKKLYILNRSHEVDSYAEPESVRVAICDLNDSFYGDAGHFGEADGQFMWPTSVALDSEGMIYVSCEYKNTITVFDPEGNFQHKWGKSGIGNGEFSGPSGIIFDKNDNLWVVDHKNNRIQQYDKFGNQKHSFGDSDLLNLPWGINLDTHGDIYVADWGNDRILKFSPDGDLVSEMTGNGILKNPSGVAIDKNGIIYVADSGNERLQVLSSDGEPIFSTRGQATMSQWGQEFLDVNPDEADPRKSANLEYDLDIPENSSPHTISSYSDKLFWGLTAVAVDEDSRVYAVETNRHRIQVFEPIN
jgi:DNA-binding beta-propeller fold protein YncE